MAGDTNSNIFINIDTTQAMAQLRALEKELTALNRALIVGTKAASQAQGKFAQSLLHNVNATGQWSAQMVQMRTATEQFASALDRSKLSLKDYFRYGAASSRTFGRVFGREFDTVSKLVEKRVKTLQSQYVQLGRNAQGAMEGMRFTPKQLNYNDVTTRLMTAIQRQQIFNKLIDDGATKLLNFGKNTQWAGRQLMVGFTIPLMLLGSQAIRTFKEIETQALRFRKVYGDLFTDPGQTEEALSNIRALGDEYTRYGLKVADTIKMAAEAAAAGNVGKELERIVDQSNKLAVLGGVTQEAAYETTLSLQNAFRIRGTELNQTIDFLNAVENQTVVAIDDLTKAIPRVAPVVQQLGGDIKDLAFFMAAMQEGGITAEQGANALKSGLASLINPSKAAAKAAGELGINLKGIIEANQGNLRNIVVGFAKSLEPLTDLQKSQIIEKIFGKYQFARISALLNNVSKEGTQAARVLDLANRSVEELALLSQRELKMAADSPLNKFNESVEKLRASLAPVGELFAKTLTPILQYFGRLLEKFNSLPEGIKKAVAIIVGIIGGIGPIFLMTFGLMANGIANIIKLFSMLRKGYQQIAYGSSDVALKTQYLSQEELENISVTNALYSAHQNLSGAYRLEATALAALAAQYGIARNAMIGFQGTNPGLFLPPGSRGKFRGYNKGTDRVPGYSRGVDSVPAMLTPGEAVIPEPQAKKNRSLIRSIIADKIPGFAGGTVFLGMPRTFTQAHKTKVMAEKIDAEIKNSRFRNLPITDTGHKIQSLGGRSVGDISKMVNGVYRLPNGRIVVYKAVEGEKAALAEMRMASLMREGSELETSTNQSIRVIADPTDLARKRKVLAIESDYDPRFANPTGEFTEREYIKQLLASGIRGDKDLKRANISGASVIDQSNAGVFGTASNRTSYAPSMRSIEDQLFINMLGVKGGASKDFAFATAKMAKQMGFSRFRKAMLSEIEESIPRYKSTISTFKLDSSERKIYDDMVLRLENAKKADWRKIYDAAVKVPGYSGGLTSVPGRVAGGRGFPPFGAAAQIDERSMASRVSATIPSRTRPYFIENQSDGFATVRVSSGVGDGQSVVIRVREADLPAFRKLVDDNDAFLSDPQRKGVGSVKTLDGITHAVTTEGKLYYAIKRKNYDLAGNTTNIVGELAKRMPKGNMARLQIVPPEVTARKNAILASPQSLQAREALGDEMIALRGAVSRGEIEGINEQKLYSLLKIKPEEGETFEALVNSIKQGSRGFASSHITPKSRIEGDQWQLSNIMLDTNLVNEALKNTFSGPANRILAQNVLREMEALNKPSDKQKLLRWILQDRLKPGGFYDRDLAIRFDAPGYQDGTFSVPGPKGAGDVVPAMLSPGEAVIPSDMAAKHRPLIADIIKDRLPGFDVGSSGISIWDDPDPTPSSKSGNWTGSAGSWRDQPSPTPSIWGDDDTPKTSTTQRLRNAARSLITDKDVNALKNLTKESGRAAKETAIATKNSKVGQAAAKAATKAVNRLGERLMADTDDVDENTKARRANTAQTEDETKEQKANRRQEKRMNFSNKMMMGTMAVGLPLTMIAGYQQQKNPESFLGRNFENIMVGSMIAGILPLLNNKIGMILGPIAAVGALYVAYRVQLSGAIKEGLKFGQSLNNTAKRLDELGTVTGKFSATAIQAEKRRNQAAAITPYDRSFGRDFLSGELGAQFRTEFLDATGDKTGFSMEESSVVLANKLSNAVTQGVLTFDQAESIAVEISRSLNDMDLELNTRANLRQILGPDGQDITKKPLEVQMRMIMNNQELNKSLMENIAVTRSRVAGISKTERNQMFGAAGAGLPLGAIGGLKAINALKSAGLVAAGTGVGAPVAIAAVVTAVLASAAMRAWQKGQETKEVARSAGAFVGSSSASVQSIQQGIDAIREMADVQVSKLEDELLIAKTAKERLEIEKQIKGVRDQEQADVDALATRQFEIIQGIVASRANIKDEKNREVFDKATKEATEQRIKGLEGFQKTEALSLKSFMLTNEKFLSGKGIVQGKKYTTTDAQKLAENNAKIAEQQQLKKSLDTQLKTEMGKTSPDSGIIRELQMQIQQTNANIQKLSNANTNLGYKSRDVVKYDPEALSRELEIMINAGMTTDSDVQRFLEWAMATENNPKVVLDIIAKAAGADTGRTLAMLARFDDPNAKKIYYELVTKEGASPEATEAINNAMEEYISIAKEVGIDLNEVLSDNANATANLFGENVDKSRDTYRERMAQFAQEKKFIDENLSDKRWAKSNKEQRKKILIELQEKAGGEGKNLTLDRAIKDWDKISKYEDVVEKKAIFSYSVIMDDKSVQTLIQKEVENEYRKATKDLPIIPDYQKRFEEWARKNSDSVKKIAEKYKTTQMDFLFGPDGILNPNAASEDTDKDTGPKKDYGWLEDLAQRLKLFKETTLDALKPLSELKRFFDKDAKTINNSLDDQVGVMRQLAEVAPGIALSPEFIRILESMDPEQFKMWAKDLFEFDKATGRLKGVTQTFRNINEGFNTARIGEFIEKQNQSVRTTSLQIQAYNKLTAAGADASVAMKVVSDEALATAIASNKIVKEEIQAIIATAKAAQDLMDKFNLTQNLADKLSSIDSQRKALIALRLAGVEAETASQFANDPRLANAIKNLAAEGGAAWADATAKIKEYNVQQKELKKLLDATADQGTYELTRLKMAQKYFEVQSQIIDMQNRTSLGKLNKELEFQNMVLEQLAIKEKEITDKYLVPRELIMKQNNYTLERLSYIEDKINESYQKQVDSVSKIYEINSNIAKLEESRLSVAEAVTRGDISAAAQAVSSARRASVEFAKDQTLKNIESQKDILTLALGRKNIEEENKKLQLEISWIQQNQLDNIGLAKIAVDSKIESLNREVTTIERIIELQKESILYFGMTKEQIDDAVTLLDLANEAGIDINSPTFLNNVLKGAKGDAEALSEALLQVGKDAIKAFNDMQALRTGTIKASTFTSTTPADARPISYDDAAALEEARRRAAEEEARRRALEEALKRAKDEEERLRLLREAEEARLKAEAEAKARAEAEARARKEAEARAAQAAAEALMAAAEADLAYAESRLAVAESEQAAAEARLAASQSGLDVLLSEFSLLTTQARTLSSGAKIMNKLVEEGFDAKAYNLAKSLGVIPDAGGGGASGQFGTKMLAGGGMVKPQYMALGGVARGLDTVPAMLRPGEFVVSKFGVDNFGTDKLKAINSGTYNNDSVYNYSINVNVKSGSNPDDIARAVMAQIKQVDSQRIRTQRVS